MLYDSLHERLLRLPDTTRVYPAHGAGSLCGRGISSERWSTIGRERLTNPALRPMPRAEFIAEVTRDVPETPVYFLHSRDLNRHGPPLRGEDGLPPALDAARAARAIADGAIVIDTRAATDYAASHPAGALHVGLDGQYASWVGTLVEPDRALVLITEPERAAEAAMRLARVGYENVAGTLAPDPALWRAAGLEVTALSEEATPVAVRAGRRVLDVRRTREWDAGHLPDAIHLPLSQLDARVTELDPDAEWVMVCASGYRSLIAASVLERAGFRRLVNAAGGMDAWRAAGLPVEAGGS
jgi:rhodanese-related sulfurtransferase